MNSVIQAAGTVIWRRGPEVLLVHRPRYDDWSLPKGKREPGEHLLITASRETQEEAFVRPVLGPRLRTVAYLYHHQPKEVDYWSAVSGDEAKASHEVDEVVWLSLGAAMGRLSYPHDREVLAGLDPRPTVPLIVVRHAHAVPKGGDDLRRPLDAKGNRDAAALAGLLACFAPAARVLSSPALRCVQTVQSYAAQAGVPVEENPLLGRTYGGATPGPVISALIEAARPAIVCVHRENLPGVLAVACAALGAEPPADPALHKGGFWVVHGADGELAAMERYEAGSGSSLFRLRRRSTR